MSGRRGELMAIGGAEDKVKARRILNRFLALAGGEDARIVVLPAASMQPGHVGELYRLLFRDLGAHNVDVVHLSTRSDAQDPALSAVLSRASGVFITGGNQLRLATLLGGTRLATVMREANAAGTVIAGTSAGASILSQHMIAFGRSGEWPTQRMVQLSPGLDLIDLVVIDQHFQQRGRIGRLMVAVSYNPFLIGLGIDEDTAVVIDADNIVEVLGRGSVVVVDGFDMGYTNVDQAKRHDPVAITDMRVHVLIEQFRYDLIQRQPIVPDATAILAVKP